MLSKNHLDKKRTGKTSKTMEKPNHQIVLVEPQLKSQQYHRYRPQESMQPQIEDTSFVQPELKNKKVICPDSTFHQLWRGLVAAIIVGLFIVQTFIISFVTSFGKPGFGLHPGTELTLGVLYILDCFLLADMVVKSRTAVLDSNKNLVEDLQQLRLAYMKSMEFAFDLIAVLPLEILAFCWTDYYERWIAITIFRSNRLLKIYFIPKLMTSLEGNINYRLPRVRAVKLVLYITLLTHICACVWFLQACFGTRCAADSWAIAAGINKDTTFYQSYVTTIYWAAATMTSTGYGDITASSKEGEVVAIFVTILGLLLFGFCLSNITSTLANQSAPKVDFMGRINAVTQFMKQHNLKIELIHKVEAYLGLVWRSDKGQALPGVIRLMSDMPETLQEDVSYEETSEILGKVPIFMKTDAKFLRMLSLQTSLFTYTPGEYVVHRGDVGREMYAIRRGLVEVCGPDGDVLATLGPGGYFGEVGLIFGESRTADVKAKTYVEVVMITKSTLDKVLAHFPLIARELQETAENGIIFEKIKSAGKVADVNHNNKLDVLDMKFSRKSSVFHPKGKVLPQQSADETQVTEQLVKEFQLPFDELPLVLRILSIFLMRQTIIPGGLFFRIWTTLSVISSCVFCFTIGLQSAFVTDSEFLWVLNYMLDAFFWIDLYIKLHVGYYTSDGILVTHPLATAKNYVRTNFLLDIIACFPFDLPLMLLDQKEAMNFARMNRLLHMYKVIQFFRYLEEPIGEKANVFREIKFGVLIMLLTHWYGCIWFMLSCSELGKISSQPNGTLTISDTHHEHFVCHNGSWGDEHSLGTWYVSSIDQYITSLYWAVATTCSVGYGDIHPILVPEMVLAIVCMITGVVFYGYIIASVAASLANADAQRARYQERLDAISSFIQDLDIDTSLKDRVVSYYEYVWLRTKGADMENLFQGIPLSLQADITLSLYQTIIEKVPLFAGTELGFMKMLSMYIKPLYILKKEYIVRKGDIGQEMYFIHSGIVEVVSEHDVPIVFDTMGAGRFFGEISIVFSCPRTASIRAQTNCDVFVLTKKDLDEVLSHYPLIKKKILETAEERQNMVKQRAAAASKKKEEEKKDTKEDDKKTEPGKRDDQDPSTPKVEIEDNKAKRFGCQDCTVLLVRILKKLTWWNNFTLGPESKWRHIRILNCFLIYLTYLTTTYMACMQDHSPWLIGFNYICELFFFVEIYLNFHMTHFNSNGELVTDLGKLSRHYFFGHFAFDMIANFPLDIFALCFPYGEKLSALSYLRLIHLLRIVHLKQVYKEWSSGLNINVMMVRISENLLQVLLFLHTFACIWYTLACPNGKCKASSWKSEKMDMPNTTTTAFQGYGTSLYWAVATMTSTGYGDIHATNKIEMACASLVMIFGKLLFGFVLGNVASVLANMEAIRIKFEQKLKAVKDHMKEQKVSLPLQQRVVNFYEYYWAKNKGSEDNKALFTDMPSCMHGELCVAMTGDYLKRIPFLKDCELAFIRNVCTQVGIVRYHQGEFIMRTGDIGQEVYIVKKGEVEIVSEGRSRKSKTREKGEYFGEMALLTNEQRKQSARAMTHVDLFVLTKDDLNLVRSAFPEDNQRILDKIEELQLNV